jgi:SAM-dependent methyltransferase
MGYKMTILITGETKKEDVVEEYKTYPAYLEKAIQENEYSNRIEPLFYEIPIGSKVLDFGCNDGTMMKILEEKRKCEVFGVDISEVAIKRAKERGLKAELIDGETLPFESGSFDAVLLMEVIVHVFDPQAVLKEIKRVLKPGGMLLGSSPHENVERYAWDDKRMHRRYYTTDELEVELNKVFYVSHMKTLTGGQYAFNMAQSYLADKPFSILFKCGNKGLLGFDSALQDKSVLRAWMGGTQTPGTFYYRMGGYADKMQAMGAETFYNPYNHEDFHSPGEWQRKIRWRHIQNEFDHILKAADMSVWQLVTTWDCIAFLRCIKDLFNKPILTDMDDWIFDIPSTNTAAGVYFPNSDVEKMAYQQISLSDYVICSTQFIKENILKIFPEKVIYVIKNAIDFDIWDNIKPIETIPVKKEGVIRIGYTGCGNHSGDLEIVKEPILALLDEFPNLEFVLPTPFESWMYVEHPRVLNANRWVSLPVYPSMVKGWNLDIGIAPLLDNTLNRAKSNLRWLEYGALKLPTVASNIYPFKNSIKQGKDGLLVSNSSKQWYEALKSLIVEERKRTSMGEAAYVEVKKNFNLDEVSKTYLSVLKEVKNATLRNLGGVR